MSRRETGTGARVSAAVLKPGTVPRVVAGPSASELELGAPEVEARDEDLLASEVASHLSMARAQLAAAVAPRGVALAHGGLVEFVVWSRRVEAASLALASARIAWACLADAVEAQS